MERSDEDLLAAVAAGDADTFSAFYRRHRAAVTRFHARRVRDLETAFDLTAETFAAVVVAAASFDASRGRPIAWLLGIAHHKLTDSQRRRRVEIAARQRLALEPVVMTDEDMARVEEYTSNGPDPVAMVAALPAEQRQAVEARVLQEREYPDIAEQIGCSEAVVRQRVHRGLRRLREQLGVRT